MLVTEIKDLKNGKHRVFLDNGLQFVLYRKELGMYQIKEAVELTEEIYREICSQILLKRAEKRLLFLLQKMDRTRKQLWQKLTLDGYPEAVIEDAIAYVEHYHYVDDLRYATTYIRYHQKQKSKRDLIHTLLQRGVSKDTTELAIESCYEGREEELLYRLLEKRHYDSEQADLKEKKRVYAYLMRKGFSPDMILYCMEHKSD